MAENKNTKKIYENIKATNIQQRELNKESIPVEPSDTVSHYIEKKVPTKLESATTRRSSNYTNIESYVHPLQSFEKIFKKLSKSKNYISALDKAAIVDLPQETINKFIEETLPNRMAMSYFYNDEFNVNEGFNKWAANFTVVEDVPQAYVPYDSEVMLSKLKTGECRFSEYYDTSSKLEAADILISSTNASLLKALDEIKDNKVEKADIVINEVKDRRTLSGYSNISETLKVAKKLSNGYANETLDLKKKWKDNEGLVTGIDPKNIISAKDFTLDHKEDGEFKRPSLMNGTLSNNEFKYVLNKLYLDLDHKIEEKKVNYYGLKDKYIGAISEKALTAANRSIGNLTINNTTYASYDTSKGSRPYNCVYNNGEAVFNKNAFSVDWNPWNPSSSVGEGFIGDTIYGIYKKAVGGIAQGNIYATKFGRWINLGGRSGLQTKSELDLQTIAQPFNFLQMKLDRKLHVATIVGFPTYTKTGTKKTGYITSSQETIPDDTNHSEFAAGRLAALKKNWASLASTQYAHMNNGAIESLMKTGPDFMSNMFDMYIFSYSDEDTSQPTGGAKKLIEFVVDPSLTNKITNKNTAIAASTKGLSSSSVSRLSNNYDFLTRVSSISIPALKRSTLEYNFLSQTFTVPGYTNEQEFSTEFSLEVDSELEYPRLFNALAGLQTSMSYREQPELNRIYNDYRPLRQRLSKQKLGILVKLTPANSFINSDTFTNSSKRYIVFEDVLFLGGGKVSFSNSKSGLVTMSEKFIYKNLDIFPFSSYEDWKLSANKDAYSYQPNAQMYNSQIKDNTNLNRNLYNDYKNGQDTLANIENDKFYGYR